MPKIGVAKAPSAPPPPPLHAYSVCYRWELNMHKE